MLVVFAVVVCLSVRASTCHGYSGWTKNGATIWLPISSKRPGGATRFYKFVQYIVNRCSQNKTTLTFAKNHANCPCVLKIWTVKHNSQCFFGLPCTRKPAAKHLLQWGKPLHVCLYSSLALQQQQQRAVIAQSTATYVNVSRILWSSVCFICNNSLR